MTDGFSKEFGDAMARVRKLRGEDRATEPQEPRRLLRRSGLIQREMPDTNFAILNFIGWVHTRGELRGRHAVR